MDPAEIITIVTFFSLFVLTSLFGIIEDAKERTRKEEAKQEKADAKKLRDMEKYCELGPWNPDLHDPWHEEAETPSFNVKKHEELLEEWEKTHQLVEDLKVINGGKHV